jgi:hypothetical protein
MVKTMNLKFYLMIKFMKQQNPKIKKLKEEKQQNQLGK